MKKSVLSHVPLDVHDRSTALSTGAIFVKEFLCSPLMDPNSNEYLTNPANIIYVRNSKLPKNTILIDLKINKNHMFKRDITCSKSVTVRVTVQST